MANSENEFVLWLLEGVATADTLRPVVFLKLMSKLSTDVAPVESRATT